MDVIEQLGKLPGHEAEAADAKELLTLGIHLPPSWVERDFDIHWAVSWTAAQRWDRADRSCALVPAIFSR